MNHFSTIIIDGERLEGYRTFQVGRRELCNISQDPILQAEHRHEAEVLSRLSPEMRRKFKATK